MFSRMCAALIRAIDRSGREQGQAMAEYGLILAVIAAVAIAGFILVGAAVSGAMDDVLAAIP